MRLSFFHVIWVLVCWELDGGWVVYTLTDRAHTYTNTHTHTHTHTHVFSLTNIHVFSLTHTHTHTHSHTPNTKFALKKIKHLQNITLHNISIQEVTLEN